MHLHRLLENSTDAARHDQIQPSSPVDWSTDEEDDFPPISGLQESFGGETQPTPIVVHDQIPLAEDNGFDT